MKTQSTTLASLLVGASVLTIGVGLAPAAWAAPSTVTADLLNVDFSTKSAEDQAQGRILRTFGEPSLQVDEQNGRISADFDGADDAYSYELAEADYDKLADSFSVECSVKFDGELPSKEVTFCGNKQGGGFALTAKNSKLDFMLHVDGSYKRVSTSLRTDQWYHVVGSFDGKSIKLYVDGQMVAETPAAGTMTPVDPRAQNMVIGADSAVGKSEAFADVVLGQARLYSEALPAAQALSLSDEFHTMPEAPEADVLNIDFADGSSIDSSRGVKADIYDEPVIAKDGAMGKHVASFDGQNDALAYPLGDQYESLSQGMTLECVFRYDGDTTATGEKNLCSNKEAGGFSLSLVGDKLSFMLHTGAYRSATAAIESGRWYHAVGVFDGKQIKLYLNGKLVAAQEASGSTVTWPPKPEAHNFVLGADSSNGNVQFHGKSKIAAARIYSQPLAPPHIASLNAQALGHSKGLAAGIESSTPAAGSNITKASEFQVEWNIQDLVGANVEYTLDGEPIEPGDPIAGMTEGKHLIEASGTDVFGRGISQQIEFTSGSIPEGNGTQTGQGKGTVTLSANATNPDGGDVHSTFYAGETSIAKGGTSGVISQLPETLDFAAGDKSRTQSIEEALLPGDESLFSSEATSEGSIPYQRFAVAADAKAAEQSVRWSGQLDPQREAQLRVWNQQNSAWDLVASGRGVSDGLLTLDGGISAEHVADGKAQLLVTAHDPFADDLDEPVRGEFEDPDGYDFSMVHFTDTQYLAEGAVEQEYSAEQQKVWAEAYNAIPRWIAENAEQRKIEYVAHTGDIVENWHKDVYADEETQRRIAEREFEFTSETQRILDETGIPNGVLPGNHDNRSGKDVGPDNLYNQYFGPERYESLENSQGWKQAQASYQSWAPGDNDNHYDLFSAGGLDFIALYLGFDVTEAEIAWANDVLAQYPDRNAMLMTHAYNKPSINADGRGAAYSHDGKRISEGILEKNKNIFLVLSGHEHGVSIQVRKDVGQAQNNVVELLADYQFYEVGAEQLGLAGIDGRNPQDMLRFGSSYLRMLQFDVERSELAIDTYSPMLGDFGATEYDDENRYDGTEDELRLPIQLQTRQTSFSTDAVMSLAPTGEVIGEATARSGWPASVVWAGLTEGEVYSWYVTSVDAQTQQDLAPGQVRQTGVFTASAAGTDTVAPELTIPEGTTLAVGDAFDPMDSVSAVDNTDGDVTENIEIVGSVDTGAPGSYALTYTVQDANGNQAIASRAVVVEGSPAPEQPENSDDGQGSGMDEDGADVPDLEQPSPTHPAVPESGDPAPDEEQRPSQEPSADPSADPSGNAVEGTQNGEQDSGQEPEGGADERDSLAATGASVVWTVLGALVLTAAGAAALRLRRPTGRR
ncbi:hypothetical protein C1H84_14885 [Glutamicibacter soli]|uniref:LamG-like jellyroll fold domain-containing protein n=1 Tax=Glutamicibacter soli TaxID=453836 RepID=A0A365YAL1_9MICC|nr:LamG-like jellyroll fold domain-containing protein [Glutamicibacter soli]RBL99691.1 hypothetical protein C1H84_14885 [Glutamicibacter soli]